MGSPLSMARIAIILYVTVWPGRCKWKRKKRHSNAAVMRICKNADSFPKHNLYPACSSHPTTDEDQSQTPTHTHTPGPFFFFWFLFRNSVNPKPYTPLRAFLELDNIDQQKTCKPTNKASVAVDLKLEVHSPL